jgi:hypothetical protein
MLWHGDVSVGCRGPGTAYEPWTDRAGRARAAHQRLAALYAVRCPECGRDLGAPGAVRQGRRERRSRLLNAGVALLLLVLVVGCLAGLGAARGVRWNAYKPVAVLVWEAGSRDMAVAAAAAAELETRDLEQRLSRKQQAQVLAKALDVHGDLSRAWPESFDGPIRRALFEGRLRGEALRGYLRNIAAPELFTAAGQEIRAGEIVKLYYRAQWRAGPASLTESNLRFELYMVHDADSPARGDPNLRYWGLPNSANAEFYAGDVTAPSRGGTLILKAKLFLVPALSDAVPEPLRARLKLDELPAEIAEELRGMVLEFPVQLELSTPPRGADERDTAR